MKFNLYQVTIHSLLVVLSILVVLLIIKNRDLNEQLLNTPLKQIEVGEKFSNFQANLPGMQKIEIKFPSKTRTLLFIFSTNCEYCTANIPNWENIYDNIPNTIRLLGVTEDSENSLSEYKTERKLTYNVYHTEKGFRKTNKIIGVPSTVLIDTSGTVLFSRLGVLDSVSIMDLKKLIE